MKDKKRQNTNRHKCAYCGRRRYETEMQLIFFNPGIVGALPMWACVRNKGWLSRPPVCAQKTVESLLMYNNTGVLYLKPVENGK